MVRPGGSWHAVDRSKDDDVDYEVDNEDNNDDDDDDSINMCL